MVIPFVKMSPTQNVTILVEESIPRAQQAQIAAKLLEYDGVGGEQVAFLEEAAMPEARMRLQMMGGEFCGNAAMSLGAYIAWKEKLPDGEEKLYPLEVSGAEALTVCRIRRTGSAYRGTVHMPFPEKFGEIELETDAGARRFEVVTLPGISHIVVPTESGLTREEIDRRIRSWNDVVGASALGVLRYDEKAQTIEPIVYVPATDSAVWERGCGSGTAALGCWLAWRSGASVNREISQPGGKIAVSVQWSENRVADLTITGTVRIMAEGNAFLD